MADTGERRLAIAARRDGAIVEIEVADSGPGIPNSMRADLFEPFQSSKTGGVGVGLSICRTIVEAYQGRIWTSEAEGGGTAFRFTLTAG